MQQADIQALGDYGGNGLLIKEKGAVRVTNTEELELFLGQLGSMPENTNGTEVRQICIEDLLGASAGKSM